MFHFSFRNQSLFLRKNTDIKLKNGWKLSFWGSFWFEIYCHGVKSQKMPKKVSLHSKKNKIRNVRQMNLVKDHKWWLFLLDAFYWKTTSQINTFHHLFHLSRRNLLVHSLFRCKTNNTNQKAKKSCVACAVFCDGAHLQCVTITIFVNTFAYSESFEKKTMKFIGMSWYNDSTLTNPWKMSILLVNTEKTDGQTNCLNVHKIFFF